MDNMLATTHTPSCAATIPLLPVGMMGDGSVVSRPKALQILKNFSMLHVENLWSIEKSHDKELGFIFSSFEETNNSQLLIKVIILDPHNVEQFQYS